MRVYISICLQVDFVHSLVIIYGGKQKDSVLGALLLITSTHCTV